MIRSFRSKALERLYEGGSSRGLPPPFVNKIRRALFALDNGSSPAALDLPGFGLHPLTGELAGFWSAVISGNWRITFRFADGDAVDVDFVDYH